MFFKLNITSRLIIIFFIINFFNLKGFAQSDTVSVSDSALYPQVQSLEEFDSIYDASLQDTLRKDSLAKNKNNNFLDAPVKYNANDSIVFSMKERIIYLYGEGEINYTDINLKSSNIKFDMANQEVHAKGTLDTLGKPMGDPVFKQGGEEFQSKYLKYNFDTKKGYIQEVISEQEGGFLHGMETKRLPNGSINIRRGKFTTCDHPHPHFYLGISKGIVIPEDKIVTGPAYIVMQDIPLPLILPFGWFPNTRGASSGILVPTYGEESARGLYLRNGGYYIPINDHVDLKIMGDIFSNGTWGLSMASVYRYRYRFNGTVSARFYQNVRGEKGLDSYSKQQDYSIRWSHRQDGKAHPTRTFSANVNLSSTRFDEQHSNNQQARINNTKTSSINYSKRFAGTPFNLSASLNHSQNKNTEMVNLSMPNLSLSMQTIYPFRRKNPSGEMKWYENIRLGYNSSLENRIAAKDTALFKHTTLKDWEKGYQHNIPLSTNFKILKYFNLSPNVSYRGMIYDYKTDITYNSEGETHDDQYDTVRTYGIYYAQAFTPSISLSAQPKVYGMYQFREGSKVQAVRHVITPSASFSYTPDVNSINPSYYKTIRDKETDSIAYNQNGVAREYSIFQDNTYGTPSLGRRNASLSLSLRNNLEMKMFRGDTSSTAEKVKIIDNFDIRTSYNPFAEEFKWNVISFSSRASFFKNKLSVTYNGRVDPYVIDSTGGTWQRYDRFELVENNRIGRWTNTSISASFSYSSGSGKGGENQQEYTQDVLSNPNVTDEFGNVIEDQFGNMAVDFNVPWSFRANYSWTKSKPYDQVRITQTFRASGDISLTENWKVSYSTGYDFNNKEFTSTNMNIHRDLHCWVMSLRLVPFGNYRSFEFQINVKSGMLRDLKWERNRNWRDN